MRRYRERNGATPRTLQTDEERLAAKERKNRLNRERARYLYANDPEYVAQNKERSRLHGRRYHIKSKFGITLDQWDQMLRDQSGRCFLCENPLRAGRTDIHVDHNHACCPGRKSCGKCIRGLACQKCNQGIGQFGDDPMLLRKVAQNLELATAAMLSRSG